jgi:hypothetical protein
MSVFVLLYLTVGAIVCPSPTWTINAINAVGTTTSELSTSVGANTANFTQSTCGCSCGSPDLRVEFTRDKKRAEEALESARVFEISMDTFSHMHVTEIVKKPKPIEFVIERTPTEVK